MKHLSPININQLKPSLGMINFFKKHLLNLSTTLINPYIILQEGYDVVWGATLKKKIDIDSCWIIDIDVCKFHRHLWGQKFDYRSQTAYMIVGDWKPYIKFSSSMYSGMCLIFSTSNCKLEYKYHLSKNVVTGLKALSIPAKEKRCFINKEHCIWFS